MKRILIGLGVVAALVAIVALAAYLLLVWRYRLDAIKVDEGPIAADHGTYHATLEHDGRSRDYLLHVPPAAESSSEPLPLVIALHGGGGRAAQMDDLTEFTALADREGFLVAFPSGVDKNWNDGRPDAGSTAAREQIEDVGFLRAMIADIAARLPLDESRVYATGISNGAFMSTRLACEAADVIAAVGLVVGTAPEGFEADCRPPRPVPFIAFLGTDDPLVPYEGGKVTGPFGFGNRGRVVSAATLESFWVDSNGCAPTPVEETLPERTGADDSTVSRRSFGSCDEGADVVFYAIDGGGHTWPGGEQYMAPLLVGKTNRDIDATALIWAFFAAHPLP